MSWVRMQAWAAATMFAAVAGVLAAVGAVSPAEAALVTASALVATLPSGWLAPGGSRRRAAEAALLPAAYALTMIADPTMRRMAVPPLLVLAALAAAAAAISRTDRRHHAVLSAGLALAVRLACGLGLVGVVAPAAAVALLAPPVIAWTLTRWGGAPLGIVAALLAGSLPLEHHAAAAAALAGAALLLAGLAPAGRWASRVGRGWLPGAVAGALLASTVAPWGGMPVARLLPSAGWPAVAGAAAACVLTPVLPAAGAGAAWLGTVALLGPVQPAPPDRAGLVLTAAHPSAELPPATTDLYLAEVAMANASGVPAGAVVATVTVAGERIPLRAGVAAAEWAHERPDVRALVAHPLPQHPVWRPSGLGASTLWGVAGQVRGEAPAGAIPVITRAQGLPTQVTVNVVTAGPSRPTPPRDRELPAWLAAAAILVAVLQLAGGTWKGSGAWVPWALLGAAALVARAPVEPLRLLAERHIVDVALAALLATWLPAARTWFARRRPFVAAAALLVPLALATPHLTPPMYGDEPFHLIVLDSLAHDHDLDLSNNYDLEHHPYNRIYMTGDVFLHSPVLAMLLLPGYLADGRSGALVLLALAGAGVVALLLRRARELGLPASRQAWLGTALLLSYPLATFSTQIWVEVPAALAATLALVLLGRGPRSRVAVTAIAVLATAVKTRLALVTFPLAAVAWWPERLSWPALRRGLVALAAAAGAGLAVGWMFLGGPLGYRHLGDLIPRNLHQPFISTGGLLFDPSGGLAFTAPLALAALGGVVLLWRRGGMGERALLLGGFATAVALLHSSEWYGGGSPPARYLVPLLPAFALGGAMLLLAPHRWRPAVGLALPLTALSWWALITRPHLGVNPGDGGWWLSSALARRFSAGAQHLFPSFLRPSVATAAVPFAILILVSATVLAARRWPALPRLAWRHAVSCALLVAAATVLAVTQRTDRVVEIEEAQVERLGGTPEPPTGTFARYSHDVGWRVEDGQGVVVPLRLPAHAEVALEGWLEGSDDTGASLEVAWDNAPAAPIRVGSDQRGSLLLPPPPGAGRHQLHLGLHAPVGVAAVFDRVVVRR